MIVEYTLNHLLLISIQTEKPIKLVIRFKYNVILKSYKFGLQWKKNSINLLKPIKSEQCFKQRTFYFSFLLYLFVKNLF